MTGNCSTSLQVPAKAGFPAMAENNLCHVSSIEIGQVILTVMFLVPNFFYLTPFDMGFFELSVMGGHKSPLS